MPFTEQFNHPLEVSLSDYPIKTPAFVYFENSIISKLQMIQHIRTSQCHALYSLKAMSCSGLLQIIADYVDGFSTSSLFEYRLGREVLGTEPAVHITSPGLDETLADIIQERDFISFNSLSQWRRFRRKCRKGNFGLRINPERSYVRDERYDPCRAHSKLGLPLRTFRQLVTESSDDLDNISGLLIHNNCESDRLEELVETVGVITAMLPDYLPRLQWINLGGGYLFDHGNSLLPLSDIAERLSDDFGLEVYFEPGKAIVGEAGFLIATVIDLFESDGTMIAVLDTSVNHLPEVFEYQYRPPILEENAGGNLAFRLAGSTCLSGDLFGDYIFDNPLAIGSQITFAAVGAYMLVKASMFNGINLPSVYLVDTENKLHLLHEYDYSDYRSRL